MELMWLGKGNSVLAEGPYRSSNPCPAFIFFLFLLQLCLLLWHAAETCVRWSLPPVTVPYCFSLAAEGQCRSLGEERPSQNLGLEEAGWEAVLPSHKPTGHSGQGKHEAARASPVCSFPSLQRELGGSG